MANSNPQQRIKIMTKELPSEIDEAVAKDVTEIMVEYRRGIQNLAGAMGRMSKITGLPPEICKVMLSGLSRNNIIDIRGYNRTPQRLVDGKMRAKAARFKKQQELEDQRKLDVSSQTTDES
jgi:hypothetical protein